MYITIGDTDYTEISDLDFRPQTDITNDSVPVNDLSVSIKTTDSISVGQFVYLYDDLNQLWARYWITYTDREDIEFVRLEAQSIIGLLDRTTLAPAIYTSNTSISTLISGLFSAVNSIIGETAYTIDSDAQSKTVKGYFPKQTARERLQWICFATNLYIQQAFTDTVQIKLLDQNASTSIPADQTYWRPSIAFQDYVTAVKLTAYSFTAGTPASGEDSVKVNGTEYIISETTVTLENASAPESAIPNEIEIDKVYIVNTSNADDIASRLALLYFARQEVSADVINNRSYMPGQMISVQVDDSRDATGFIESASFEFGVQAKSKLKIVASDLRTLYKLVISYIYDNMVLAKRTYSFPAGYEYQITNPYLDKSFTDERIIYRPTAEYISGTMTSGTNTRSQTMAIALRFNTGLKVLQIISVSDIEFDTEDRVLDIG